jgi:nicotinamide phosphoribosyltransferase
VVENILPKLSDEILSRNGKLVIRPDSGDPIKILCGDPCAPMETPEYMGLITILWNLFGGSINSKGYKELNPKIGAIYGDSITKERCNMISAILMRKGFASTNVVFGIGSYTYQYVTRDTNGFAVKATWAMINDKEHFLYKDPKTDDGVKKSARGRIIVTEHKEGLVMYDGLIEHFEKEARLNGENLLQPVWANGQFLKRRTLEDIRQLIAVQDL